MFGLKIYKVSGHSMEPSIKTGQYVLIKRTKVARIGDLALFRSDNQVLLKRIVKVLKRGFFVRGDNYADSLDSSDIGLVSPSQILGKVIWH